MDGQQAKEVAKAKGGSGRGKEKASSNTSTMGKQQSSGEVARKE